MKRLLCIMLLLSLLMLLVLAACLEAYFVWDMSTDYGISTRDVILVYLKIPIPFALTIINTVVFRNNKILIWIYPCLLVVVEIVLAVYILQKGVLKGVSFKYLFEDVMCGMIVYTILVYLFDILPPMIVASIDCVFIGKLIQKLIKNHKQIKEKKNGTTNE